jgi:hypothetical protein
MNDPTALFNHNHLSTNHVSLQMKSTCHIQFVFLVTGVTVCLKYEVVKEIVYTLNVIFSISSYPTLEH